jgi:hypothetical protein
VDELDHHCCDVVHHALFLLKPAAVGLINQLQETHGTVVCWCVELVVSLLPPYYLLAADVPENS